MPEIMVEPEKAHATMQRIAAEADAETFQAEKKSASAQAEMEAGNSDPESWLPVASQCVEFSAVQICPAWDLTDTERQNLSGAIAEVLDKYFPGAMEGFDTWSPLAKLAGTAFFLLAVRFDFTTGRLPPLHKRTEENADRDTRGRNADADDGAESERQNTGNFTIGGDG